MSIWEIILIIVFKKVLFSVWVLILTLQFLVYIATWQLRTPSGSHFILYELKRIALGEFMDDLDVGTEVAGVLGIEIGDSNAVDEEVGESRLGTGSAFSNFGATLVLGSILFLLLIILIVIIVIIASRTQCSEKSKERMKKLKSKVFFNPIIRYLLLNSLKLNISAFVVMASPQKTGTDVSIAAATLTVINLAPLVCCFVIYRNRRMLLEKENIKSFGTLYEGRNAKDSNHKIMLYPVAFFYRRTAFTIFSVYLFNYPALQMMMNQLLTLAMAAYLLHDSNLFESRSQKVVEVGSEVLFLTSCLFLQQFTNLEYGKIAHDGI